MKTKPNKRSFFRTGTTTVEAAIVLPLLLLVTFGALKYGWLFLKSQQITNAARQAARLAIRPGPRESEVTKQIETLMNEANITDYKVEPYDDNPAVGASVTLKITVPIGSVDILPLPKLLIPAPPELGATVTMSKEGPVVQN